MERPTADTAPQQQTPTGQSARVWSAPQLTVMEIQAATHAAAATNDDGHSNLLPS